MCDRGYHDAKPLQTLSQRASIGAGGGITIPQRIGRVRLVVSVGTPGTLEIFSGPVTNSNIIAAVSNPANPVTIDFEHWGAVVPNLFTIFNPTGGALTADIAEVIEGY